ncbi:MAG: RDD family protein [Dermatophilaceae bacterium]|nr:RDD family protein [Intrasporangiaceae bacterium]
MSIPPEPPSGALIDPRTHIGVGEYATDGTVTSEAVEVELPVASVLHRLGSGLIDLLVLAVAGFLVALLIGLVIADVSFAVARTLLIVTLVLLVLGIPVASETLTRGKTVGKLVTGLRTVRDDGGPISARHAIVRGLVAWVEVYLAQGTVAIVAMLLTSRNRRLGDLAAGTYVINERQTMRMPVPTAMPPQLAAWAAGADIAALPDSLALAARQFLHRAPTLTPHARHVLGQDLARQVSGYVAPQPPHGHHPETFLAAVLADRRRRDAKRLAREADLRARVVHRSGDLPVS